MEFAQVNDADGGGKSDEMWMWVLGMPWGSTRGEEHQGGARGASRVGGRSVRFDTLCAAM